MSDFGFCGIQKADSFTFAADDGERKGEGNAGKSIVEEFSFAPQTEEDMPKALQAD